jgi:endonuclease III
VLLSASVKVPTATTGSLHPFKKTGTIWRRPSSSRTQTVRRVCEILTRTYGTPRFGNPSDPLQDLLYVILSNKTAPQVSRETYARLRKQFPRWEDILEAPITKLQALLRPAGLSHVKSRQIRAALRAIRQRFGRRGLIPLKRWQPEEAEDFLTSLPGVSKKVAKCVMMYTLGMRVLPVDSHVHRVAVRLGWTNKKRADQCHEELEALIAPTLRKNFHVCCIAHGRKVCRPAKPLCHQCGIRRYCAFYRATR